MKKTKIFNLILVFVLILGAVFSGCSQSEDFDDSSNGNFEEDISIEDDTIEIENFVNDSFIDDDIEIGELI